MSLGAVSSVQFKPFVLVAKNNPAWPFGSRKNEKSKTLLVSAAKLKLGTSNNARSRNDE